MREKVVKEATEAVAEAEAAAQEDLLLESIHTIQAPCLIMKRITFLQEEQQALEDQEAGPLGIPVETDPTALL